MPAKKSATARTSAAAAASGSSKSLLGGKKGGARTKRGKITRKDVFAARSEMPAFIKMVVRRMRDGDAEVKEQCAAALMHIALMDHGDFVGDLYQGKCLPQLVRVIEDGSASAQANAAAALAGILSQKATHQHALVDAGGLAPLVNLLRTGSAKVQEEAAAALATLDADVSFQSEVIKAGAIPPLVATLQHGSAAVQASGAQALANAAAYSMDAQRAIAKAGAIAPLLALLGSVGRAQRPAAGALAKLARGNKEIQDTIAEAGGVPPLLSLLNQQVAEVQVASAAAIAELARGNATVQSVAAKAGAIGPLLALLSSRSAAAQANGMSALAQLASHNQENQDAIARQDGVRLVVSLLDKPWERSGGPMPEGAVAVLASAASAVMELSLHNGANQKAVVECNGIAQLAALMTSDSTHTDVKAEVAGALWALAEDAKAIQVSIAEARAIPPLVQLLGDGEERAHHHASGALSSLGLDNRENQIEITQLLIEPLSRGAPVAQERAATALWTLIRENASAHEAIAKAADPAALVELLKAGIPSARDYAVWALSLSIEGTECQATIAEAGGVGPLIAQLSDKRPVIQQQAAEALAKLAHDNRETNTAITQAGGVEPLLALIRDVAPSKPPKEPANSTPTWSLELAREASASAVHEKAVAALASLASDPAARDEIVGAGGIAHLTWLLEAKEHGTKRFAATALARLSHEHEATQSAIAASGAIKPLVALLDGSEGAEAQEAAAGAVLALAETVANRLIITEAGGIGFLVSMLGCNNLMAREHAEGALVRLSIEPENRVQIINKLVAMLQDPQAGGQEQAAAALANLARESEDNRKSIVDANGIDPLIELLGDSSSKAKENAVSAIKEICKGSKSNQMLVAKGGGIARLTGVLAGFSANTFKESTLVSLMTLAASALQEMAKDNRHNQDAITEAGAIPPLVGMLTAPVPELQARAAGALANLAHMNTENQGAITRTGAVAPLCSLIKEGSSETKVQRARRSPNSLWMKLPLPNR